MEFAQRRSVVRNSGRRKVRLFDLVEGLAVPAKNSSYCIVLVIFGDGEIGNPLRIVRPQQFGLGIESFVLVQGQDDLPRLGIHDLATLRKRLLVSATNLQSKLTVRRFGCQIFISVAKYR